MKGVWAERASLATCPSAPFTTDLLVCDSADLPFSSEGRLATRSWGTRECLGQAMQWDKGCALALLKEINHFQTHRC